MDDFCHLCIFSRYFIIYESFIICSKHCKRQGLDGVSCCLPWKKKSIENNNFDFNFLYSRLSFTLYSEFYSFNSVIHFIILAIHCNSIVCDYRQKKQSELNHFAFAYFYSLVLIFWNIFFNIFQIKLNFVIWTFFWSIWRFNRFREFFYNVWIL